MGNAPSCSRVSDNVICRRCAGRNIVKNGHTKTGKQQYCCKSCSKKFIEWYSYNAYHKNLDGKIIQLTKEGLGIRSTARVLKISNTTLLKRILSISKKIKPPAITRGKTYEVDEVRTFIKSKDKLIWIVCAMERITRQIVSFNVGPRTNKTLNVVLKTLTNSNAKRIYTDGLRHYRFLIDQSIHRVTPYATNHIERNNLTLRTHIKRLNRRTICFSRSMAMLQAGNVPKTTCLQNICIIS